MVTITRVIIIVNPDCSVKARINSIFTVVNLLDTRNPLHVRLLAFLIQTVFLILIEI